MNAAVFISHSSKDRKTALTICGALEHRGVRCWIASRDVRPGANFEEAVVQAIRVARVMVLVFTANANNSDEMKKEIVLAGQHRLVVIPVRAEDVVPNDAFSYEFATRQWINLFEDWENAIEGLVSQIEFTLGEHPAAQEQDVSPSMSRSTFAAPHARNWPVIIGIVASAVLLIAAGIGARYYFSAPTAVVSTASVQAVAPTVKSLPPSAQVPSIGLGSSDAKEWLTSDEYQQAFDNKVKDGSYPVSVKGRCANDVEQFHPEWKGLPIGAGFTSYHALTKDLYNRENQQLTAQGYSVTSVTTFKDCSGQERYQATWLKGK